jgi:hypothetical protein
LWVDWSFSIEFFTPITHQHISGIRNPQTHEQRAVRELFGSSGSIFNGATPFKNLKTI